MKKQKLNLKSLEVKSFKTNLEDSAQLKGGSECTRCFLDCEPCSDQCTDRCGSGGCSNTCGGICTNEIFTCIVQC